MGNTATLFDVCTWFFPLCDLSPDDSASTYKMPFGYSQVSGRLSQQGVAAPKTFGPVVEAEVIYPKGTSFPSAHDPKLSPNYRPLPSNYGEVLKKMKQFQVDNNLPIHLKGGPGDKMLFGATVAICGIGLLGCFKFYYDMSFPKKAE